LKLIRNLLAAGAVACLGLGLGTAHAALTTFQSYTGAGVGVSTDGWGSQSQAGTISANVPAGATVLAAYLYTSTFGNASLSGVGGTLQGTAVSYSSLGTLPAPTCCDLTAARADVTSILKPLIDGGAGGLYNFRITETSGSQDGSSLVVIYKDPATTAIMSVGILDGFAKTDGDSTAINFAKPLDPTAAGFFAEMRLGIGFSFNGTGCGGSGQSSTVDVNGTRITNSAGCNDDSADSGAGNGNLFTMGGDDDPFSTLLPSIANDHERYDLADYIATGDTSIAIKTTNASNNDNIFLAVFHVFGEAGFNAPPPPPNPTPEPAGLALVGMALAGLGVQRKLRRTK
jgi:hypothetical protein